MNVFRTLRHSVQFQHFTDWLWSSFWWCVVVGIAVAIGLYAPWPLILICALFALWDLAYWADEQIFATYKEPIPDTIWFIAIMVVAWYFSNHDLAIITNGYTLTIGPFR